MFSGGIVMVCLVLVAAFCCLGLGCLWLCIVFVCIGVSSFVWVWEAFVLVLVG